MKNLSANITAVYLLKNNDEVVYVGKTTDLIRRITYHLNDKKEFNNFDYIECDNKRELDILEYAIYRKYRPTKYNEGYVPVPDGVTITLEDLAKEIVKGKIKNK